MKKILFFPFFVLVTSTIVGQYQSSILHLDENHKLVYHSDEDGNRIPDFSHAGYKNGEVDLPTLPIKITLSPISGDNTAHIQDAIDRVARLSLDPNGFRGAVLLMPGIYPIHGTINIETSGIVLRGSGEGKDPTTNTIMLGKGTDRRTLIEIGSNEESDWRSEVSGTRVNITSEFVPAGSRTIQVEDSSVFSIGDNVIIKHPSTDEWLATVNYGGTEGDVLWKPGEIDMYFNRFVTSIEGNKIKVDTPIYDHLNRSLSQSFIWVFSRNNLVTETGIENLRVDIQTTGSDDDDHPWTCIEFSGVEDCWAKNVTTLHFGKSGFSLYNATRSTVLNCTAIDPTCFVKPGRMYNFNLGSFSNNILFKNCYASRARHAFVSNGTSSVSGIVFTNCSSVDEYTASESHRRWGEGLLWDNSSFNSTRCKRVLGLYNRGDYGTGHGWTGTQQVAWNISAPNNQIVIQKPPIGQNYAIGCSATVDNKGPFLNPIGYVEGTGEKLEIPSLYEAQLTERLTYDVGPDTPWKLKLSKSGILNWIDIATDENNYIVERSLDGGKSFEVIARLEKNTQSFAITEEHKENYQFRIKALNIKGSSAYSNIVKTSIK